MSGERKCCFNGCTSTSRNIYTNISLFRFPKDERRCSIWKQFIRNPKYDDFSSQKCYNRLRLCSLHFEDDCYSSMQKNRLKRKAVPTLQTKSMKYPRPPTFYAEVIARADLHIKIEEKNEDDPLIIKYGIDKDTDPLDASIKRENYNLWIDKYRIDTDPLDASKKYDSDDLWKDKYRIDPEIKVEFEEDLTIVKHEIDE